MDKAKFVRRMSKKKLSMMKRQKFDFGGLIGGLLGSSGGAGGTGFNLPPGTDAKQIADAYNANQTALANQNAVATTLTPGVAAGANTQDVLAGQLSQQATGQGPNVAQTMLNTETGKNIAAQGAMAAGQRGAGANVGLIERQAAQQGAQTQQGATAEGAKLQAEQQLGAQKAAADLAANRIAQGQGAVGAATTAEQGEQGILQGANTAANNTSGQLANTRMGQQPGGISGVASALGPIAGLFDEGGEVSPPHFEFVHKMTETALKHHKEFAKGGVAKAPNKAQTAISNVGQAVNPASAIPGQAPVNPLDNLGKLSSSIIDVFKSHPTDQTQDPNQTPINKTNKGGFSPGEGMSSNVMGPETMGQVGSADLPGAIGTTMAANGGEMHPHFKGPHENMFKNYFSNGGKIPALVSPGEVYLKPDQVEKVVQGDVDPSSIGKKYPGKAKVKGDSTKNDVIPDDLDSGGVVIDREHMGSAEKRKEFVRRAIAKKKAGGKK